MARPSLNFGGGSVVIRLRSRHRRCLVGAQSELMLTSARWSGWLGWLIAALHDRRTTSTRYLLDQPHQLGLMMGFSSHLHCDALWPTIVPDYMKSPWKPGEPAPARTMLSTTDPT
jgi:hypothetical protein